MDTLVVSRQDGIVTVVLNRPEIKNAINPTMFDELHSTLSEVSKNDDDRVLIITGAGDAFCSGADLSGDRSGRERHHLERLRTIGDVALRLHRLAKPTIAKVNGVAAGAGLNLALGCDLIVSSDQARFSAIFARRGLSLDFGGSWLLPRLIGLHKAKEIALFADILSAEEAADFGIVNRVVPASELDAVVNEWATRLAAGPPLALSMTKTMLNNAHMVSMEQALEDEARAQAVNLTSEDAIEALKAFRDKRDPTFKGR
ncbi:MAG: enoyl-CoA hydratase-related protein [Acidimicrobiia bacterium]